MPVERICQIIEGPARVAGLAADEGLIMAAARDAAVDDALPLLAFALRELSDGRGSSSRLALADYQALGDMKENLSPLENAVRRRADATLARRRATDEDLAALKDALVPAAVRVNLEGEYVRRPALFDEMPARARPMIEALVDARLLTSSADDGVRQVEVVHEALLRKWPLLRGWLDEEREFIIGREQLRHDVADWRNASGKAKMGALLTGLKLSKARIWLTDHARHIDKEEQSFIQASIREADSQVRRRRFLMRAAVTAAVVATMFAGLAGWQWNVADKATVLALNSEQEALAQKRIADNQASLATERGTEAERQRDASQRSAAEAVAQQRIAEANQAAALTSLAETRLSNNPAEAKSTHSNVRCQRSQYCRGEYRNNSLAGCWPDTLVQSWTLNSRPTRSNCLRCQKTERHEPGTWPLANRFVYSTQKQDRSVARIIHPTALSSSPLAMIARHGYGIAERASQSENLRAIRIA